MDGVVPALSPAIRQTRSAPHRSREETRAAINALSGPDLQKLKRFAEWIARGRSGLWDHDDLLQEAIQATLVEDRRHWSTSVDIIAHLRGCIRSLANSWQKQKRPSFDDAVASNGEPSVASGEQRLIPNC
jgi:DNA-directed RNA polymerase specialized sigma24 family protein